MKWTYDWLLDYLDTTATPTEIADNLTRIGLEIEDLIVPTLPIAAKIVECDNLPGSDHLHILKVDDGSGTLRQVVCGAPNVRVGLISALAVPGCKIGDMEIKSGKIRGVLSDGMMCSGRELGINDDDAGIMELDKKQSIGKPIADNGSGLIVFDAGITPNRPDYLAVRGIARDLAAAGIGKLKTQKSKYKFKESGSRKVIIENESDCPTYRLCEIHGIKMSPSNPAIASRLSAIGMNPKNAPIDATNYICYDMGQPMHCFDADEINGNIIVRNAKPGEKFTDLFGAEHELIDTDLVISDATGILALAGVVGGLRGMTTDKTKNIILECAYFNPVTVRRTAKRIGVSTDASYRYERGIDPNITDIAIGYAAEMIMDACGGKIVGEFVAGRTNVPGVQIAYNPGLFIKKAGIDIPADMQKKILKNLGFEITGNGDNWIVTPTSARVDIEIPENIVSELIRLYGYDKIASTDNYTGRNTIGNIGKRIPNIKLKRILANRGLCEHISFGFGNLDNEKTLFDKSSVVISNPITSDMNTLRNNLLGNMLDAVTSNEKRGYPDLNMFELGTVFDGDMPEQQHNQLVIMRSGDTSPKHWQGRNRARDVFDIKSDLIALIGTQNFIISTDNPPKWAHPFRYGAIMQGKKKIAEFGELHPVIAKHWKIKTNVMIGLVADIENLPTTSKRKQLPISDFQPITRDFAFIITGDFAVQKIISAARSADSRISDIVIFDSFDMGDNNRSIAFTITIIPTENMSDSDLLSIQNAVIANVEKDCPAKIRDK